LEKSKVYIILFILIFLNILAWVFVFDSAKPSFLFVNFFDVGQGDAILIVTPKRHQILIDGGPNQTILEKLSKIMPFWDRTIDLIILSHPEKDHIAGLIDVLENYKVENILWTGIVRDTAEYRKWEELIEKEGAKIFIAKSSQKIKAGEIFINTFYPFESFKDERFKNSNDTSIVSKLIFGNNSFLFTGDITKITERKLIEKDINLKSNILKVGHHGSKTSTTEEFLERISPEMAVISVGGKKDVKGEDCDNKERNRYGHPNCEVLERLEKFDILILRTDKNGDIKVISDGSNLKVEN